MNYWSFILYTYIDLTLSGTIFINMVSFFSKVFMKSTKTDIKTIYGYDIESWFAMKTLILQTTKSDIDSVLYKKFSSKYAKKSVINNRTKINLNESTLNVVLLSVKCLLNIRDLSYYVKKDTERWIIILNKILNYIQELSREFAII